jgi:type IV secretory pathway VirD2 relaxase
VRVTYSRNLTPGQWKAHGRYIGRESAGGAAELAKGMGFAPEGQSADLARTLSEWQKAGDERLFKIIVSPEFGDRINLEEHIRALMAKMEHDLNTQLQWVAVVHRNTEHHHVHIALRGITEDGRPLRLDRVYIQQGIRSHAEDLCTRQLGYRTELDTEEGQRREVTQQRFTSLDRLLSRSAPKPLEDFVPSHFAVELGASGARGTFAAAQQHHLAARLLVLQKMGLAQQGGEDTWYVQSDFETVLRAMQCSADRQKALASSAVTVSDPRLPLHVTRPEEISDLEGRVLGHGEEESTARNYLLLEGTDARVHFIYYNADIDAARHRGELRPGAFARLRKWTRKGNLNLDVQDLGKADDLLSNRLHFSRKAQSLIRRGIVPAEAEWGGWLGQYNATLKDAATLTVQSQLERSRHPSRSR